MRSKIRPCTLDGVKRHTDQQKDGQICPSFLAHAECRGVGAEPPQIKFRDAIRLPFSKGKEDRGRRPQTAGAAPLWGSRKQGNSTGIKADSVSSPQGAQSTFILPAKRAAV